MFFRLFFACFLLTCFVACQPEPQQNQQKTPTQPEAAAQPILKRTPQRPLEDGKAALERMDQFVANQDYESAVFEAEQAAYQFRDVISIDPNYSAALAGDLGRAFYYQNNYKEALGWYKQAAEADPSNATLHHMEGMAYFNLGNIAEGQNSVARSISAEDSDANRQAIVSEMMRIGNTSFDYGTAYIEDGYPSKGTDYQKYGLAMYQLAHELGGFKEQELVKQILSWATYLNDSAVVATYKPLVK